MRYVLDSCVAAKWALAEIDSDKALKIRDDFSYARHELLIPDFFPLEIAHILTRAERQRRISGDEAQIFLMDILSAPFELYPSLPLLPRAYQISSQARIGIYDCLYAALAEQEGCELLTADEKLKRALSNFSVASILSL
jgi:predicted nucleic acid-binding protein